MKRSFAILLGLIGAIVALGIAAAWMFVHIDWNRAKPWLGTTVGEAIGREVRINGDLHVSWQRDPQLEGWRSWAPYAMVRASDVTVGNTGWAKQPVFGSAKTVEFDLSLLPLLAHTVSVPAVRFLAPD